jgi:hypothetical protein
MKNKAVGIATLMLCIYAFSTNPLLVAINSPEHCETKPSDEQLKQLKQLEETANLATTLKLPEALTKNKESGNNSILKQENQNVTSFFTQIITLVCSLTCLFGSLFVWKQIYVNISKPIDHELPPEVVKMNNELKKSSEEAQANPKLESDLDELFRAKTQIQFYENLRRQHPDSSTDPNCNRLQKVRVLFNNWLDNSHKKEDCGYSPKQLMANRKGFQEMNRRIQRAMKDGNVEELVAKYGNGYVYNTIISGNQEELKYILGNYPHEPFPT